jgi:hypothetical protein
MWVAGQIVNPSPTIIGIFRDYPYLSAYGVFPRQLTIWYSSNNRVSDLSNLVYAGEDNPRPYNYLYFKQYDAFLWVIGPKK